MDREFLEDYHQREVDLEEKYMKWINNDGKGPNPLFERFIKPQKPFVRAGYSASRESIWAQIPLAGSLFFKLENLSEDMFEYLHHTKVSEIPALVDFIKDTGRLQITLGNPPLAYDGLDYLKPIFEELKPVYEAGFPIQAFISPAELKKYYVQYVTIGKVAFFDFMLKSFHQLGVSPRDLIKNMVNSGFTAYAYLKVLGYNDLVEELENLMVDNPESALNTLYLYIHYITNPFVDPICKLVNHSSRGLKELQELPVYRQMDSRRIRFPSEIGQFLMETLTHYPESFTACKELIAHYETTDLIKVATALNQGISEADYDLISESKADLSQIMRELWKSKSLKRKVTGLKFGIPVSVAAIGAVAFGPIGGIGGFLAGLGFSVGSKILDIKSEVLSEKIAKFVSPSYQANIFDFKKKIHLP